MARPRLQIDDTVVEAMASVGATNVEIADFVGCNEEVIRRRFHDILIKSRADMKERLRRAQITTALNGNPAMLIWLGKQMLGQKDVQTVETRELPQLVIE